MNTQQLELANTITLEYPSPPTQNQETIGQKSIKKILKKYKHSFGTLSGAYILRFDKDPDIIKIGKSKFIESRIENYLTHYPRDIRVLACIKAESDVYGQLERDLHQLFYKYRYEREWFHATKPVLEAIDFIVKEIDFMPYTLKSNGQWVYDDPDYVRRVVYETTN